MKKPIHIAIMYLFFFLAVSACHSENGSSQESDAPTQGEVRANKGAPMEEKAIEQSASESKLESKSKLESESNKPKDYTPQEYILAMVMYDNFRVRKAPNSSGEVIAQRNVGDYVYLTGKAGDEKFVVHLRGVYHEDPYVELHLEGEQSTPAWIYGGGVIPLYSGHEALSSKSTISEYVKFMVGIPNDDPDKGQKAFAYMKQNFVDPDAVTSDALFQLTRQMLQMQERPFALQLEKNVWTTEEMQLVYNKKYDMSQRSITKSLAASGFELQSSEGLVYPIVDLMLVGKNIPGRMTPVMTRFLRLQHQELAYPSISDGHLAVSKEELQNRITNWESFLTDNPNFFTALEAQKYIDDHVEWKNAAEY